jgi:MFS family permease
VVTDEGSGLALRTLAATTAIQVFTSLAGTATAVLAPELARDLGLNPKWVGVFVGLVYGGGMFACLFSGGLVRRYGAIRVSQVCTLLCAIGVAMLAVTPAHLLWLPVVAALIIGLGYGPITPASSHVLTRTTEPSRMSLTFSIKQTGVPAGVALGGALLPWLSLQMGWRHAFFAVAVVGLFAAFAAQSIRPMLDDDRDAAWPLSLANVLHPLQTVMRTPALRQLAWMSLLYAAVQLSVTSFLVVYLTETLQWSLVAAGLALTLATLGGVAGRIGWGALADRLGAPLRVLAVIGGCAAAGAIGLAMAEAGWAAAVVLPLAFLLGVTAVGWNGVQLAEVARRAPPGHAGAITGASSFVTYSGVVAGPPAFALLAASTGSYRVGFVFLAVLALAGAACLARQE